MADDTRQPPEDLSKAALNVHPENKAFMGQVWQGGKQIAYKPPESANIMPGGTQHTAGGQVPEVTLLNALTTGVPITEIHTRPCVRDSLLQGMVGGFALGGTRLIFGSVVWKACTWTAYSFMGISVLMYQYCMYTRQAEKEGMLRAMEIINKKSAEKQAREERKTKLREERRETREKELDMQYKAAAGTSNAGGAKAWYQFW